LRVEVLRLCRRVHGSCCDTCACPSSLARARQLLVVRRSFAPCGAVLLELVCFAPQQDLYFSCTERVPTAAPRRLAQTRAEVCCMLRLSARSADARSLLASVVFPRHHVVVVSSKSPRARRPCTANAQYSMLQYHARSTRRLGAVADWRGNVWGVASRLPCWSGPCRGALVFHVTTASL